MTVIEGFAPAKINLTLHVTGRRADGYHELDSLVVFADIGDRIRVEPSDTTMLTVDGPMAAGVPVDDSNLVVRAAAKMGLAADIHLEKHLPNAAGLGGGSSDAAATLGALSESLGKPVPGDVHSMGADIPVCQVGSAARMRGIGERVEPLLGLPVLHAVLVNPNLPVMTKEVFAGLERPDNAAMPETLPQFGGAGDLIDWLATMRNDLEAPAIKAEPVIQQVFDTLSVTPGCHLARMSGSGGTCFGLYSDAETAASASGRLREKHPGWWVRAVRLNA
jgi:4-diphosphocytidyl-2-C-methyl-D-erythritol kinase